jgi:hypothetical protein
MVGDQSFAAGRNPRAKRMGFHQRLGFGKVGQHVVL